MEMLIYMNITIFGVGAVGGVFAARLALAGHNLCLIARESFMRAVLDQGGLRFVSENNQSFQITELEVRTRLHKTIPLELILVTTKAYDNLEVSRELARFASPETRVLLIQNGVGNSQEFTQHFPSHQVYRAITTIGAQVLEPGFVIEKATGTLTLGKEGSPLDSEEDLPFLEQLCELFTTAQITTTIAPDIQRVIWRKTLINAALNPVCAILGVKNGCLLDGARLEHFFEAVLLEGQQILESSSIFFSRSELLASAKAIVQKTAENRCSMLQDLLHGKRTEIDYLNFQFVKLANQLRVAAPLNEQLYSLIKHLEEGNLQREKAKNQLLAIVNRF
ncbi:MAG: 2-dehydropantoate 2-reductase [Candidatus Heimdallarchaeota archaeon]|nr:2-dehydropantoate 2-reductase [Candidatus Heimdallarchaeota archaeon]